MNDEDIAVLARRHVGVSHNPESNMKLASGAAPIVKYIGAGVALGLGTDGAASNNDLDMFEAMRQAAFLAKLETRDPTAVPARASAGDGDHRRRPGARHGRPDWIARAGEEGRPDHASRCDAARQTPLYDAISHLVYVTRGDDVRTTIVNGRILMLNRRPLTLDRGSVIADAHAASREVRRAVAP